MNMTHGARSIVSLIAAILLAIPCVAQVEVNKGDVLTESQLAAGMFNGQTFILQPGTTFEINSGGAIDQIGGDPPFFPNAPFDLGGATINVHEGGLFTSQFDPATIVANVLINVHGGLVGEFFRAEAGTMFTMTAGMIDQGFRANPLSDIVLQGGAFGFDLDVNGAASLTLVGGEFLFNGAPASNLASGLVSGDVFSGTLADGTVFILSSGDAIPAGTTTLSTVALPPADLTHMVVTSGEGPSTGLRAGQHLTISGNATLRDHFAAVSATLDIDGGSVGDGLEFVDSDVQISDGEVGDHMRMHQGSHLEMTGGVIGADANIYANSLVELYEGKIGSNAHVRFGGVVNLFGGSLGAVATGWSGSEINVDGGVLEASFDGRNGSVVTLAAGAVGHRFRADSGSQIHIHGGEFLLNGAPIADLSGGLSFGDDFTGTLADGSSFIFSARGLDELNAGTIQLHPTTLPPIDLTPMAVTNGPGPNEGLRTGQELTISGDATLRDAFAVVSATLNIDGGTVGYGLEAIGSQINMTDGEVGEAGYLFEGSTLNLFGGRIGASLDAHEGSLVHMSGGIIDDDFFAFAGSEVLISGGEIKNDFTVDNNAMVTMQDGAIGNDLELRTGARLEMSGGQIGENARVLNNADLEISGGAIGDGLQAFSGSRVTLYVTQLTIDGDDVALTLGQPVLIPDRNGALLEGTLADGAQIDFVLNGAIFLNEDFFHSNAELYAVLAKSIACLASDLNDDGMVDGADLANLLAAWGTKANDLNGDGVVNGADLAQLLANWGSCS